jgi:hypothetical protein
MGFAGTGSHNVQAAAQQLNRLEQPQAPSQGA